MAFHSGKGGAGDRGGEEEEGEGEEEEISYHHCSCGCSHKRSTKSGSECEPLKT